MQIGIGLPNTVPGVDGETMLAWARRADEGPFSTIAVLDRPRYDSYEPLSTLAAAAGVTERVGLATTIVISPLRETLALAKTAATINALSGGRLTLGVALGARRDDYELARMSTEGRGERLTQQLATMQAYWTGDEMGPLGQERPALLVGGTSSGAVERAARHADGYVHSGGPPRAFAKVADQVRQAWAAAGREGRPSLWGMGYYALGEEAVEQGRQYLLDYYAFTGSFAERIAQGMLDSPETIQAFRDGYEEAGCNVLLLFPTVGNVEQVARLADVVR